MVEFCPVHKPRTKVHIGVQMHMCKRGHERFTVKWLLGVEKHYTCARMLRPRRWMWVRIRGCACGMCIYMSESSVKWICVGCVHTRKSGFCTPMCVLPRGDICVFSESIEKDRSKTESGAKRFLDISGNHVFSASYSESAITGLQMRIFRVSTFSGQNRFWVPNVHRGALLGRGANVHF